MSGKLMSVDCARDTWVTHAGFLCPRVQAIVLVRIALECHFGVIQSHWIDEQHFAFDCPAYSHIRSQHLNLLQHCCTIADFVVLRVH